MKESSTIGMIADSLLTNDQSSPLVQFYLILHVHFLNSSISSSLPAAYTNDNSDSVPRSCHSGGNRNFMGGSTGIGNSLAIGITVSIKCFNSCFEENVTPLLDHG